MDRRLDRLDEMLANAGADGYLLDDDASNGDQRYLSGLDGHDPFVTLYASGEVHLLIGGTDYARATRESNAVDVARLSEYDYERKQRSDPAGAKHDAIAEFLVERDVKRVAVPERFPLAVGRGLETRGIDVVVDESDALERDRAIKTPAEIEAIETAQRATEAGMRRAETMLSESDVVDGTLRYDGEPLTGAHLKSEIEKTLLDHGAALRDTIVACGADSADPHGSTSGPLRSSESIVIDVFPVDIESGYHSDMTRTFVKGQPSSALQELYDQVDTALEMALGTVAAGVTGDEVNDRVFTYFEDQGHRSRRRDEDLQDGALHYVGHGVGLDVHEAPTCQPGGEELEEGNVITLEPGLYYPDIGGVRIEDVVEVTANGYRSLTTYPKTFVVD